VFNHLFAAITRDSDLEWLMDRRHRHPGAGPSVRGAKGGREAQALGCRRSGYGTKPHAVADALGLSVRFALGPGQQNDMPPAYDLFETPPAAQLIASIAPADSQHTSY
jgi:hypothetical protein